MVQNLARAVEQNYTWFGLFGAIVEGLEDDMNSKPKWILISVC